jgi:hypothetical protein
MCRIFTHGNLLRDRLRTRYVAGSLPVEERQVCRIDGGRPISHRPDIYQQVPPWTACPTGTVPRRGILVLFALDPAANAVARPGSLSFRQGRSFELSEH